MNSKSARCLILSDHNISNLVGYLNNLPENGVLELTAEEGPYGQVQSVMMDPGAACWKRKIDALVLWTSPEIVSESFRRAISNMGLDKDSALAEITQFSSMVREASSRAGCLLLPTWTMPPYFRGLGMLDWRHGVGFSNLLAHMNLHLAEQLADVPNVFLLDSSRWVAMAGKYACNPKLWYMGKIVYGHEVFQAAAADIFAALMGVRGQSRKLVVLDLDDTLWGGIVGDTGWENLKLGGHDPIGEAYMGFQRELKSLTRRGIILGIVSKNDEEVALEAIRNHPEMVLKANDFAGWRINWNDKAQNMVDLVSDLNLGLQSVVFIDDNPAERARVGEQLPELLVPDWPKDPLLYRQSLLELSCFDAPVIGAEDQQRTAMYAAERERKKMQVQVSSPEEWLKSMDLRVELETLHQGNLPRTAQLLNKTNQMNLRTRRLSESELLNWSQEPENTMWTLRVKDRFGDSGLTGILSVRHENDILHIVDFILSCRVFGRKVEDLMLYIVIQEAKKRNIKEVRAEFIETKKNKPCREFLEKSGMEKLEEGKIYIWDTSRGFEKPEHIALSDQSS